MQMLGELNLLFEEKQGWSEQLKLVIQDDFVAPAEDDLNYKDIGEQELLREH